MPNQTKAITASYISIVLRNMQERYGCDPNTLLHIANIDPKLLDSNRRYISKAQYLILIKTILQHVDSHQLAFDLIHDIELTHHGALGLLILCGLNLRQVLKALLRFYRLRGNLVILEFLELTDKAVIRVTPSYDLEDAEIYTVEIIMLTILKTKQQLIGRHNDQDELHFSFPKPDNYQVYPDFNGIAMQFNQPHNQIVCPRQHLDIKLKSAHNATYQMLNEQCEQSLQGLAENHTTVDKLKNLLASYETEFPNLDQAAEKLFMSSRTLSRRLKAANTNYQQCLDQEKINRAKVLLEQTDLSVTQIAFHLYFTDSSYMTKVFKRHVGKTPRQYRLAFNHLA